MARKLFDRYAESGCPVIDRKEIEHLGSRAVLVDVRTAPERAVSVIPGAVSREQFEASHGAVQALQGGKVVVPYCTIGKRSGMYANSLAKKYPGLDVRNGEGVVLWALDDGKFIEPVTRQPTKRMHVFGPAWAVAPSDVYAVTFGLGGAIGLFWMAMDAARRSCGCCCLDGRDQEVPPLQEEPMVSGPREGDRSLTSATG